VKHQVLSLCTASPVLSVVYATEKNREDAGLHAHPKGDGIADIVQITDKHEANRMRSAV
jgi:hypothetical protein